MTNTEIETVGAWDRKSTTVHVHRVGCVALNRFKLKLDAWEVQDMKNRGYKISICKCVKAAS